MEFRNLRLLKRHFWILVLFYVISHGNCQFSEEERKFQKEAVKVHNVFRAVHLSPALKLDLKLIKQAKKLANEAARRRGFHNLTAGENAYEAKSAIPQDIGGREVTEAWYQDVCSSNFNFKHPENFLASSFTQIVWKGSTRFGIAKSTGEKNGHPMVFVVALYKEPGNVQGLYSKNIQKGRFIKSYCDKVKSSKHFHGKDSRVITTSVLKSKLHHKKTKVHSAKISAAGNNSKKSLLVEGYNVGKSTSSDQWSLEPKQDDEFSDEAESKVDDNNKSYANEDIYDENEEPLQHARIEDQNSEIVENFYETSKAVEPKEEYEVSAGDKTDNPISQKEQPFYEVPQGAGPTENYYTTQSGTQKFDTVIKQSLGSNSYESHGDQNVDPSLGSEYVSFPQESSKGDLTERFWDYVPIDSRIFGPKKARVVLGEQRSPMAMPAKEGYGSAVDAVIKAIKKESARISNLNHEARSPNILQNNGIGMLASKAVSRTNLEAEHFNSHTRVMLPEELQRFRENALTFINSFRKIHNAPALALDTHTSAEAENWANIIASRGKPQHSPDTTDGETIFYECGRDSDPAKDAVISWYKEACDKNYNFESENDSSDAKQFSQMVWKDTEKLGIGVAKKEIEIDNLNLTCFFIVGRFRSPGNKAGSYRRNVLRGQFSKPFCKKLDSFLDNAVEEKERSSYENQARTIGTIVKKFDEEILAAHNNFRKVHNSPRLALDKEMCAEAQEWATILASKEELKHKPDNKDGENLYMACVPKGRQLKPWKAVVAWYREACDAKYDFNKEEGAQKAGHFTQVVWKDSKNLGVGVAIKMNKDGLNCTYVVGRYRNAGNILGLFKEKVQKGSFVESLCTKISDLADSAVHEADANIDASMAKMPIVAGFSNAPSPTTFSFHSEEKSPESSKVRNQKNSKAPIVEKKNQTKMEEKPTKGDLESKESDNFGVDRSNATDNASLSDDKAESLREKEQLFTNNMNDNDTIVESINGKFEDLKQSPLTKELLKILKKKLIKNLYKSHEMIDSLNGGQEEVMRQDFLTDALQAHNKLRMLHSSSNLQEDQEMSKRADEWAYILARRGVLEHENGIEDGENLYYSCNVGNDTASARDAIAAWYKEGCERVYDFDREDGTQGADDFTQIVWKGTKRFGIGLATSENDGRTCTYIVARYRPAGNVGGEFSDNVGRSFDPKLCEHLEYLNKNMTKEHLFRAVIAKKPEFSKLEETALSINNIFREIHGSPKLDLNHDLCQHAENWAKHLTIKGTKEYDMKTNEGQNVYSVCKDTNEDIPVKDAFVSWYGEVCDKNYNFEKDLGPQGAGQFTQMIWKDSTDFGIGKATRMNKDGKYCTYIVARYESGGNIAKAYKDNVMKGKFDKSSCGEISSTADLAVKQLERSFIQRMENVTGTNAFQQRNSVNLSFASGSTILFGNSQRRLFLQDSELTRSIDGVSFVAMLSKQPGDYGSEGYSDDQQNFYDITDGQTGEYPESMANSQVNSNMGEYAGRDYGVNRDRNMFGTIDDRLYGGFQNLKRLRTNDERLQYEAQPGYAREKTSDSNDSNENADKEGAGQGDNKDGGENGDDSSSDSKSFQEGALKAHNKFRETHGSDPMALDDGLSKAAEEYAKKLAEKGDLSHSPDLKDGENLAFKCTGSGQEMTGQEATLNWYKEICSPGYKFGSESPGGAGHFTQVVWKKSQKLGIGRAFGKKNGMKCTYVVARYQPRGNMVSEFAVNVLEGSFNQGKCSDLEKDTQDIDAETNTGTAALKQKAQERLKDYAGSQQKPGTKPMVVSESGSGSGMRKIKEKGSERFAGKDGGDNKEKGDEKKDDKKKEDEKKEDEKKKDDKKEDDQKNNDDKPPETEACKSNNSSKFQDEALAAHNMFRKIHGSPALKLDDTMSNEAEAYAKILAKDETLYHSSTKDGENLAKGCNDRNIEVRGPEAVKDWYNEVCSPGYSFSGTSAGAAGHFTQVVWKETTKLGIGMATGMSKTGLFCTYVVARYRPAGNFIGKYKDNVKKGSFKKDICKKIDEMIKEVMSDDPKESKPDDGKDAGAKDKGKEDSGKDAGGKDAGGKDAGGKDTGGKDAGEKAAGGKDSGKGGGPQAADKVGSALREDFAGEQPADDMGVAAGGGGDAGKEEGGKEPGDAAKDEGKPSGEEEKKKDESEEFPNNGLEAHNLFRKIHGSPEMKLNPKMSEEAKKYAEKLAETGKFEHSSERDNEGENLAMKCSSQKGDNLTAHEATKLWYEEVCKPGYDFSSGRFSGRTGHFTQVVWKESTELGMGTANSMKGSMYCWYAVARYKPAGNFMGKFKKNVEKGKFTNNICDKLDEMIAKIGSDDSGNKVSHTNYYDKKVAEAAKIQKDVKMAENFADQNQESGPSDSQIVTHTNSYDKQLAEAAKIYKNAKMTEKFQDQANEQGKNEENGQEQGQGQDNQGQGSEGNGSSGEGDKFQKEGLSAHNKFRKIHGTSEVKLNKEMCDEAEKYAKELAKKGGLEHAKVKDGENLAYDCSSAPDAKFSGAEATRRWYTEVCKPGYSFGDSAPGGTLHFTQVVWEGTKEIGIGMATGKKDGMTCTYVVGRYRPAGNMQGEYKKNVPKGDFSKDVCDKLDEMVKEIEENGDKGGAQGDNADNGDKGSEDAGPLSKGKNLKGWLGRFAGRGNQDGQDNSGSKQGTDDYAKSGEEAHNVFRKIHDAKEMKMNSEMSKAAEEYAKKLASTGSFQHSSRDERKGDGENLAMKCTSEKGNEMSAEEATKNWYGEVCDPGYNFDSGSFTGGTGHFTQVVWDKSVELGIGRGTTEQNGMFCTYVVGRYRPAGNMMGDFQKEVKKGSFTKSICDKLDEMMDKVGSGKGGKKIEHNVSDDKGKVITGFAEETGGSDTENADNGGDQSAGNAGDSGGDDFAKKGLEAHNMFRKTHEADPMELDDKMSKEAEDYAKELAKSGTLKHADTEYGENLAMKCSSQKEDEMTAEEATKNWYAEVCKPGYDFNGEGGSGTGHFTQVVWKGSKKLGIGKATANKDGMFCTYVVGRYKEQGNFQGKYKENVAKGSFDKSNCDKLDEMIAKLGSGG